jgi:hypothetical protein
LSLPWEQRDGHYIKERNELFMRSAMIAYGDDQHHLAATLLTTVNNSKHIDIDAEKIFIACRAHILNIRPLSVQDIHCLTLAKFDEKIGYQGLDKFTLIQHAFYLNLLFPDCLDDKNEMEELLEQSIADENVSYLKSILFIANRFARTSNATFTLKLSDECTIKIDMNIFRKTLGNFINQNYPLLHLAIKNRDIELVKLLLELGANTDIRYKEYYNNQTELELLNGSAQQEPQVNSSNTAKLLGLLTWAKRVDALVRAIEKKTPLIIYAEDLEFLKQPEYLEIFIRRLINKINIFEAKSSLRTLRKIIIEPLKRQILDAEHKVAECLLKLAQETDVSDIVDDALIYNTQRQTSKQLALLAQLVSSTGMNDPSVATPSLSSSCSSSSCSFFNEQQTQISKQNTAFSEQTQKLLHPKDFVNVTSQAHIIVVADRLEDILIKCDEKIPEKKDIARSNLIALVRNDYSITSTAEEKLLDALYQYVLNSHETKYKKLNSYLISCEPNLSCSNIECYQK